MLRTASGSIPMPRSPPRASPLSLSRIRWYLARFVMGAAVLHAGPGRVKRLVSLWKAPAANLLLRTAEIDAPFPLTPALSLRDREIPGSAVVLFGSRLPHERDPLRAKRRHRSPSPR